MHLVQQMVEHTWLLAASGHLFRRELLPVGENLQTEIVWEELPRDIRRVFRELARFLLANEFDDIVQLKGGADPAHWPGAEVRQLHSYTSLV